IADVDLSRDGTRIALAIDERHGGNHKFAGSARVLDLATGAELGKLTPANAVHAVAFSPDGAKVLCCSADDTTRMFKAQGGAEEWRVGGEADDAVTSPNCVAFDPKGDWTVVGGSDGFARVLEAESGTKKAQVPKLVAGGSDPGAVTHVAFSPNGKLAASACIDNVVRLFNLNSDELYAVGTEEVLTMAFSPNGRWLGVGCFDRALVIDNGEANQG
ncbi:MAG: WD40 repeat domain-containing protein, partial [Streptomyces sp.]|nr:WD40 repeat domain-containing protein [Streptomyces sp.]